jgi:cytosine/adenosine deaminase-related metal-dependent hydrolase
LSIAKEIAALQHYFPQVPLSTILHWATQAGATALQWNQQLGSFQKGKKPGLVLLNEKEGTSERIA